MSGDDSASAWRTEHGIAFVETIVADFAGVPRGKIHPVAMFGDKPFKLPPESTRQRCNAHRHERHHCFAYWR